MNANLLAWLISAGLDEQRAKLYLVALGRGEARGSELAKELGVSRTAIYDNLKFLAQRGFIHIINEGKRQVFVPLHPQELYKRCESQRAQLKDLLGDFLAVYAAQSKQPFVQLYRGRHAAREVYEDILAVAPNEYLYLSSPQVTFKNVDRSYIRNWVSRRVAKGIRARALRTRNLRDPQERIFNEEFKFLREIRYLAPAIDLKSTIYVYDNNIGVISSQEEQNAVIIYSPDFSFSLRQIFEYLWGISRRK